MRLRTSGSSSKSSFVPLDYDDDDDGQVKSDEHTDHQNGTTLRQTPESKPMGDSSRRRRRGSLGESTTGTGNSSFRRGSLRRSRTNNANTTTTKQTEEEQILQGMRIKESLRRSSSSRKNKDTKTKKSLHGSFTSLNGFNSLNDDVTEEDNSNNEKQCPSTRSSRRGSSRRGGMERAFSIGSTSGRRRHSAGSITRTGEALVEKSNEMKNLLKKKKQEGGSISSPLEQVFDTSDTSVTTPTSEEASSAELSKPEGQENEGTVTNSRNNSINASEIRRFISHDIAAEAAASAEVTKQQGHESRWKASRRRNSINTFGIQRGGISHDSTAAEAAAGQETGQRRVSRRNSLTNTSDIQRSIGHDIAEASSELFEPKHESRWKASRRNSINTFEIPQRGSISHENAAAEAAGRESRQRRVSRRNSLNSTSEIQRNISSSLSRRKSRTSSGTQLSTAVTATGIITMEKNHPNNSSWTANFKHQKQPVPPNNRISIKAGASEAPLPHLKVDSNGNSHTTTKAAKAKAKSLRRVSSHDDHTNHSSSRTISLRRASSSEEIVVGPTLEKKRRGRRRSSAGKHQNTYNNDSSGRDELITSSTNPAGDMITPSTPSSDKTMNASTRRRPSMRSSPTTAAAAATTRSKSQTVSRTKTGPECSSTSLKKRDGVPRSSTFDDAISSTRNKHPTTASSSDNKMEKLVVQDHESLDMDKLVQDITTLLTQKGKDDAKEKISALLSPSSSSPPNKNSRKKKKKAPTTAAATPDETQPPPKVAIEELDQLVQDITTILSRKGKDDAKEKISALLSNSSSPSNKTLKKAGNKTATDNVHTKIGVMDLIQDQSSLDKLIQDMQKFSVLMSSSSSPPTTTTTEPASKQQQQPKPQGTTTTAVDEDLNQHPQVVGEASLDELVQDITKVLNQEGREDAKKKILSLLSSSSSPSTDLSKKVATTA